MNPGYIAVWIAAIIVILLSTGWSSILLPGVQRRYVLVAGAVCLLLQAVHAEAAFLGKPFEWYGSVFPAAIALAVSLRGKNAASLFGYLILCSFITGMIWGSVKQIYYADPVFYWIHPVWDAPLLAGLLAGAFTSKQREQFALLFGAAIWAEAVGAMLSSIGYEAEFGSASWWDGFFIAIAMTRSVSLFFGILRTAAARLPKFAFGPKDNRDGDLIE